MLATYYSNEYFDYEVDGINRDYKKFGGGSMVPSEGLLSRWAAFKAFIGAITHS
jgi:4-hydroxybenzoate polyprenyltransferase